MSRLFDRAKGERGCPRVEARLKKRGSRGCFAEALDALSGSIRVRRRTFADGSLPDN